MFVPGIAQFPSKDRKVQTVKDLNIPWSKLFTPDHPGAESLPAPRHTAMSTLLMDDSPRKAEVQPYNHLCVKEYSNVVRNRDLVSLQEEMARVKPPSHPPPTKEPESLPLHPPPSIPHPLVPLTIHHPHSTPFNLPPPSTEPPPDFQFDQSVGIQPGATLLNPLPFASNAGGYPGDNGLGHGVIAPQMLFKNPSPSMVGYQNPQPFQRLSPPQQMHHSQSHPQSPLTEAPGQSTPVTQGNPLPLVEIAAEDAKPSPGPLPSSSTSKKRKRNEKREIEREASGTEPIRELEYDETLLAIVGILDEIKHQSNVASWVRENGLWGPHPPQGSANHNIGAPAHDPSGNDREDTATLSDNGSVDSGRHGEGKKKRRDAVTAFFEASVIEGSEDGGLPHPPAANEKRDEFNTSDAPLWFDNLPTMRYWVERGRNALRALGIPIEHGLKL